MRPTILIAWTLLLGVPACARAVEPTTEPFTLPPIITDDKPSTEKAPAAESTLFSQAAADAKRKMDAAEEAVKKDLEKSPDYLAAKLEVAKQTQRLDDAKKSGEMQDRIDAMRDLMVARHKLTATMKEKLEQNTDYAEAKKQYDSLTEASKAQSAGPEDANATPTPTDRDADATKAVRLAIASHNFLIGMTYQECVRAASATPQTTTVEGDVKTCRWAIRGTVGSHTETERSIYGVRTYVVRDSGVVGYVQATFINGRLASFERHNHIDR